MLPVTSPTSPDSFERAESLLAGSCDGAEPSKTAAVAVQAIEHLTQHFARFFGEAGVCGLLARSAALASATCPWLAAAVPVTTSSQSLATSLRTAMEQHDPRAICDGFTALLSTFVELLGRLIGEGLVRHLLHDAWPGIFPPLVKELT